MSIGFRKSLFGFNTDEVIEYIEKTHKKFSQKEKSLNEKINALDSDLEATKKEKEDLALLNAELQKQLDEFNAKYEEIERLSENIGKLYLVAQSSAKSIFDNSEKNAQIASQEVNNNLEAIENAHSSLKELRQNIADTSNEFIAKINGLMESLGTARSQIDDNTTLTNEAKYTFEQVYENCKL